MREIRCFIFSCFAVASLAACGAGYTPDFDLSPRPGYTLDGTVLGNTGIPALILSKNGTSTIPRPAVILLHGGAVVDAVSSPGLPYKEEWFRPGYIDFPYRLASKSMLVVVIDAAWAESRIEPSTHEEVMKSPIHAVFDYYLRAAAEMPRIVDYLAARRDVDPARIGVAGKSGGAITALLAACQEPRLAAVVSWKGGATSSKWSDCAVRRAC